MIEPALTTDSWQPVCDALTGLGAPPVVCTGPSVAAALEAVLQRESAADLSDGEVDRDPEHVRDRLRVAIARLIRNPSHPEHRLAAIRAAGLLHDHRLVRDVVLKAGEADEIREAALAFGRMGRADALVIRSLWSWWRTARGAAARENAHWALVTLGPRGLDALLSAVHGAENGSDASLALDADLLRRDAQRVVALLERDEGRRLHHSEDAKAAGYWLIAHLGEVHGATSAYAGPSSHDVPQAAGEAVPAPAAARPAARESADDLLPRQPTPDSLGRSATTWPAETQPHALPATWPLTLGAALLLIAILPLPYSAYGVLRLAVATAAGYGAVVAYRQGALWRIAAVFAPVAFAFLLLHGSRTWWLPADLLGAAAFWWMRRLQIISATQAR